jgi:hypothetical protein
VDKLLHALQAHGVSVAVDLDNQGNIAVIERRE